MCTSSIPANSADGDCGVCENSEYNCGTISQSVSVYASFTQGRFLLFE